MQEIQRLETDTVARTMTVMDGTTPLTPYLTLLRNGLTKIAMDTETMPVDFNPTLAPERLERRQWTDTAA
jgi:hypothetical protein